MNDIHGMTMGLDGVSRPEATQAATRSLAAAVSARAIILPKRREPAV